MPKLADNTFQDAALDSLKNNVTKQVVCSTEPTTFTQANVTYNLAEVALASGDFTHSDGDTSGRKTTIAAKSAVLITTSGTANWVALVDVTNSILRYRTTCTAEALTANGSNKVNIPTWKIEITDPA